MASGWDMLSQISKGIPTVVGCLPDSSFEWEEERKKEEYPSLKVQPSNTVVELKPGRVWNMFFT